MPYSRILIPVDGSEYSKAACNVAAALTQSIPGKETLHLLHCIVPIPDVKRRDILDSVSKEQKENAEFYFHEARKILEKTGNSILTHTRKGYAARVITEAAKEFNCSLIIMGTRGKSDLPGMLLGSVAHDVLQLTNVPVLLVTKASETHVAK